jgi:hypothetical protein
MFFYKLLLILNFTKAVSSKTIFRSIFVYDGVLCAKEIHMLGPMDIKIYSLERKPQLSTADKVSILSPKLSL